MQKMVLRLGIEPRSVGPEPTVLPLDDLRVVRKAGFEPATPGIKDQCSTIELLPIILC